MAWVRWMPRKTHPAPPWWKTLLVAAICLAVYHSNGLVLEEVDAIPTAYVAWSVLRHGDLTLARYPEILRFQQVVLPRADHRVSRYPPGAGLAALPFLLPTALVGGPTPTYEQMRWRGKWMGSTFTAATVALFFWLASQVAPRGAFPATVVLGLGTTLASTAAQAGWAHGPTTFWIMVGTCLLWKHGETTPRRSRYALAAGLALGTATLTRAMAGVFLFSAGLLALAGRRPRTAVLLALGALLPVLALLAYNDTYFDSPVAGGYAASRHARGNWSTPTHWGLAGLLVSPSRGLFVFSPALLVALAGFREGSRWLCATTAQTRGALGPLLIGSGLQTLICATWTEWPGGWSYGPRLLTETMPAWALLMAVGYQRWATDRRRRAVVAALVAISIAIHLAGIQERSGYHAWHRRIEAGETSYWSLQDHLIAAQLRGPHAPVAASRRGELLAPATGSTSSK